MKIDRYDAQNRSTIDLGNIASRDHKAPSYIHLKGSQYKTKSDSHFLQSISVV